MRASSTVCTRFLNLGLSRPSAAFLSSDTTDLDHWYCIITRTPYHSHCPFRPQNMSRCVRTSLPSSVTSEADSPSRTAVQRSPRLVSGFRRNKGQVESHEAWGMLKSRPLPRASSLLGACGWGGGAPMVPTKPVGGAAQLTLAVRQAIAHSLGAGRLGQVDQGRTVT